MSERRVYIDTSLYLGVLLGEETAKQKKKELAHSVLCSSSILFLEAERNLVRMSREKIIPTSVYEDAVQRLQKDIDCMILRDFTLDLCLTGSYPAVRTPRSLDLIHLRTAQWFVANGGLKKFFTLDAPLAHAARELGLPV